MVEKTVVLKVDTRDISFKLKSLSYKERNECIRKSTKVSTFGSQTKADIDPSTFNEWRLYYAVMEPAEFLKNIEKIGALPDWVGDKLIEELDKISEVTPFTKPSSEGQQ